MHPILDVLNQAICQCPPALGSLTQHSARGMQYLSIQYAELLIETGSDVSVGSVGDSYDSTLAETIIGLFKIEAVKHLGSWKTTGQLNWETTKWVHWYNKDRLHGAIGCQTPSERENAFSQQKNELEKAV